MKNSSSYLVLTLIFCALVISGITCHAIMPLSPINEPTWEPYWCVATIYRDLPGGNQFTERYETYLWPDYDWDGDGAPDADDAYILCSSKIDDYITNYMAPGFTWKKQNISVYPAVTTMDGVDCGNVEPSSPTYGAPTGSALSWQDPDGPGPLEIDPALAYVWVQFIDNDGNPHTAEPKIDHALIRLAERTGVPDSSGGYVRGERHIRFSHISLELKDFTIAGMDVTDFRIHNIGTLVTSGSGKTATITPESLKLYMYAHGEINGESGTTSQCFVNDRGNSIGYVVYPEYFVFSLNTVIYVGGLPLTVKISLTSPSGAPFNIHQPYVTLPFPWTATSPVDLTPYYYNDGDGDLSRFLWFENFEDSVNERFLGEGMTLNNVRFAAGEHEITVIAYDNQGAYYPYTSALAIGNTAPVAVDDSYMIQEDTVLAEGSPGVLGNDADANGDPLTAAPVTSPAQGTLTLFPDGGFIYTPNPNFNGLDTFTYKANDGTVDSNVATVTITVNPVNDPPVANDDSYTVDEDSVLNVSAPGVLANDVDVDGDPIMANLVSGPTNGSITLNSDGLFTYTPNPNYTGGDTFTYKANDGTADSNTATVTITVIEVPEDKETEDIINQVNGLVSGGALNSGQGTSLTSKLNVAIKKIKEGKTNVACNLLQAFINEVNSLVSEGVLSVSQAQPLINKAYNIMAELGC